MGKQVGSLADLQSLLPSEGLLKGRENFLLTAVCIDHAQVPRWPQTSESFAFHQTKKLLGTATLP
jgi:hypothetical protein